MHLLDFFDKFSLRPENAKELKGLILDLAIRGRLTEEWRKEHPITLSPAGGGAGGGTTAGIEPASVLLQRIKAEKARLIQEKKIRKEKPLPEITKEEIPFGIPEGWEWCRLNSAFTYGTKEKASPNLVKPTTWVLELEDVEKQTSKLLRKVRCSDREFKSSKNVFYKGDVIYGKLRPYLDKVIVADEDGICTTEMIPIKSYANCESEYLRFHLKSSFFIEYANSSTHGMNLPRMGTEKGEMALIPLPPLPEQQAIVAIVNQLMAEVDELQAQTTERAQLRRNYVQSALRRLTTEDSEAAWQRLQPQVPEFFDTVESIDKLKEAILQLAVQGKLTRQWREENPITLSPSGGAGGTTAGIEPASVLLQRIKAEKARLIQEKKIRKEKPLPVITEEEIPFGIPEGWEWCRLQELTEIITKGSSPKWQGVQYVSEQEGILFITSENVGNYELIMKKRKFVEPRFNDIEPRSILKKNDILMNIVGGSIGRTAIFNLNETANINQAVTIIRLLPENTYGYFLHFFNSPLCVSYMYDKQVDNARPNLSMGNISKFLIPLPPLPEQQAIVAIVNQLMAHCDEMKAEIERRNALSKDFLQSSIREVMEQPESLA